MSSPALEQPARSLDEVAAEIDQRVADLRRRHEYARTVVSNLNEQLIKALERREAIGEEISARAVRALRYPPTP